MVSRAVRGVPDVVCEGRTGLLAPPADEHALSRFARELLLDAPRREAMGRAAADFVALERSVHAASVRLDVVLSEVFRARATNGAKARKA